MGHNKARACQPVRRFQSHKSAVRGLLGVATQSGASTAPPSLRCTMQQSVFNTVVHVVALVTYSMVRRLCLLGSTQRWGSQAPRAPEALLSARPLLPVRAPPRGAECAEVSEWYSLESEHVNFIYFLSHRLRMQKQALNIAELKGK